MIIVVVTI